MASNKGKQPAPKLEQGPDDQLLFDDKELDRIFNQEASLVQREQEVVRVLAAFKLNPYDILDLDHMPGAKVSDQDIRAPVSSLSPFPWGLVPLTHLLPSTTTTQSASTAKSPSSSTQTSSNTLAASKPLTSSKRRAPPSSLPLPTN